MTINKKGRNNMLKVGDTIKCRDAAEAINTMSELAAKNIRTDFLFEVKGQRGLWLVVEKIINNK